ncbi:MAG: NADH oxidase, partial [bacterium]
GAHGYLVSQFLSPVTNARTDSWGGSLEKRMRFAKEICYAIRETVGD